MRIGVVTTSYPRWDGDFAGGFVRDYVDALRHAGHCAEVIAPSAPKRAHCTHWCEDQSLTPLAAGPDTLNPFYGDGVPDNLRYRPHAGIGLAWFARSLRRELKRRNWDAQINHWAFPFGQLRARKARHLGVFHSADLFALEHTPARGAIAHKISQRFAGLHFVSRTQRERFEQLLSPATRRSFRSRCTTAPMPPVPLLRLPPRSDLRAQKELRAPTILVLGRLVPIKAVERALATLSYLPEHQLVIAGSGPERQLLEQLARPLGSRVRFVGSLARDQSWTWLACADALLVPSRTSFFGRTEGMPTVIAEARAVGCPVVTTIKAASENYAEDAGVRVVTDVSEATLAAAPTLAAALRDVMRLPRKVFQPRTMDDLVNQHLRMLER